MPLLPHPVRLLSTSLLLGGALGVGTGLPAARAQVPAAAVAGGLLGPVPTDTLRNRAPRPTPPTGPGAAAAPAAFPASPDSVLLRRRRLRLLAGGYALSYGTLYTGLATSWYTGERVPLRWFNDWPEWKQIDKAGHFWGAFHESRGAVDMLRWAGLSERKALWYGAFVGFALQSPIEILDGRDPQYGASASDLAANLLGSAGVLSQQLLWHDLRLMPKFSFHATPYARQRPNVLGRTLPERWLKDYNGQTYWLCADVGAFLKLKPGSRYPRWLQPALGYGGGDLVYNAPADNARAGLRPYRQYYLSLDVDLRRIPTRHVWLRRVFYTLSIFHLPAPALEVNGRGQVVFHPLYF